MPKCPHCQQPIDIHLIKAPPMQADTAKKNGGSVSDDLGELLGSIVIRSLKDNERTFVTETQERYDKYKDRTRMSEKQMAWLKKIAASQQSEGEQNDSEFEPW